MFQTTIFQIINLFNSFLSVIIVNTLSSEFVQRFKNFFYSKGQLFLLSATINSFFASMLIFFITKYILSFIVLNHVEKFQTKSFSHNNKGNSYKIGAAKLHLSPGNGDDWEEKSSADFEEYIPKRLNSDIIEQLNPLIENTLLEMVSMWHNFNKHINRFYANCSNCSQ